jgi:hypothetical protein
MLIREHKNMVDEKSKLYKKKNRPGQSPACQESALKGSLNMHRAQSKQVIKRRPPAWNVAL